MDFASLPADVQEEIREKQRNKKLAKRDAMATAKQQDADPQTTPPPVSEYPASITRDQYFGACRGGLFRDPSFPPTERSLENLLAVLNAGDSQARRIGTCNYFQFSGSEDAVWDPRFNARLAYEGFFTITMQRRGKREPLPELQPFYGVLTWPNFGQSKHVRKVVSRLRRLSENQYELKNCADPQRTWKLLNAYHCKKYGSNWLTKQYFDMLRRASDDPSINFKMHCIELYAKEEVARTSLQDEVPAQRRSFLSFLSTSSRRRDAHHESQSPCPLAGEIGFTVGRVYTSLSGWTEERTKEGVGTVQLVLLGRWLQQKGYAFWSLGHCYSPQMDYKRQLGHRIYPRTDFLALLKEHRGCFRLSGDDVSSRTLHEGACTFQAVSSFADQHVFSRNERYL